MKDLLIMVGKVLLGVLIVTTILLGSNANSMESKAKGLGTELSTEIDKITN